MKKSTAREAKTNPQAKFFNWPLYIDVLELLDQLELNQLCVDTGCNLEDLPKAMDDWDGCSEQGNIVQWARLEEDDDDDAHTYTHACASIYIYIYIYIYI